MMEDIVNSIIHNQFSGTSGGSLHFYNKMQTNFIEHSIQKKNSANKELPTDIIFPFPYHDPISTSRLNKCSDGSNIFEKYRKPHLEVFCTDVYLCFFRGKYKINLYSFSKEVFKWKRIRSSKSSFRNAAG